MLSSKTMHFPFSNNAYRFLSKYSSIDQVGSQWYRSEGKRCKQDPSMQSLFTTHANTMLYSHHWRVYLPLPRAVVRVVCLGGGAETCLLVLLVTFLPPAWPTFFTPVLVASPDGFWGVAWCFLVGVFGVADSVACGLHLLSFLSTGAQRSRAP